MPAKLSSVARPLRTIRDAEMDVYDDGYLRIEHDNYYVACGNHSLRLALKEFLILSRLARKPERIVLSEEIWNYAWKDQAPFSAESLHVHIYRLRRKLAVYGLNIENMVNVGYRLILNRR
jgi:two-component system alkaline phosphatase synthesis response regulator PhoP